MVENIRELNKVCQKPNYKTVGNWMVRHILRDAALPITWLLLHTPVTAHQVTGFSFLVAIAGGFFVSRGSAPDFLIGMLLLQFWYLLDHVDGQIARYRKTSSMEGLFFDYMMHHMVNFIPLFCLGWAAYQLGAPVGVVAAGYIASISVAMIAILNDCRSKTMVSYLMAISAPIHVKQRAVSAETEKSLKISLPKRFFSLLHKSCEGHVVLNLLTLFSIIYLIAGNSNGWAMQAMEGLVFYYAIAASVVWITKLCFFVYAKKISSEFLSIFETEN